MYESELEELGQTLAAARKRRGWSQAAMAKRLAVSRDTISRMERGEAVASEVLVGALAVFGQADALLKLCAYENDALGRAIAEQRRSSAKRLTL